MAKLDFDKMWRNHPLNRTVTFPARMPEDKDVGGTVIPAGAPSFGNQCAIRMGVALREAGVTLGQLGNPAVSWYHDSSDMFILRAGELASALTRANIDGLGSVEKLRGDDAGAFADRFFGRRGIIYFKDYWARAGEAEGEGTGDHIDLWNGYRTTASWLMEYFSWLGYYANYGKAKEVWFWPVES